MFKLKNIYLIAWIALIPALFMSCGETAPKNDSLKTVMDDEKKPGKEIGELMDIEKKELVKDLSNFKKDIGMMVSDLEGKMKGAKGDAKAGMQTKVNDLKTMQKNVQQNIYDANDVDNENWNNFKNQTSKMMSDAKKKMKN